MRSTALALAHLGLGDTTRALDAMERAAGADGDLLIGFLLTMPFDELPWHARFAAVLKRFNLDLAQMVKGNVAR